MKQVNLYEAKTQLSKLVDRAAQGETIVIAKDGKPMATLGPIAAPKKEPRKLGLWAQPGDEVDFDTWWRDWKESDRLVEEMFEESLAQPEPKPRPHKSNRKRKA
jgi:prevent-host-death family protein